jgi:hypothetical protein
MHTWTLTRAAILGAALLTGCGTDLGPPADNAVHMRAAEADLNAVDHTKYTIAFSEININPCNGEEVQLAGTIVGQSHLVGPQDSLDNGANLHEAVHEVVSESGTGLTTGASYRLHATFTEGFNRPAYSVPQATFHERQNIRVTSQTPGLTYTALATLYIVVLPSGEFKVTRFDEDHFVCAS